MKSGKTILYATLVGLAGLTASPNKSYGGEKEKNPRAFYFTGWED